MGAYSYNPTAASNTSVDGIGAQGSDSPDNIDNLVRALAASDAALVRDLGGANTVAGTADAITVALADPTAATAYFDGMRFSFRVGTDSTSTAPTLNVDSIGAKTIKKTIQGVESALIAGDLQAGQTAEVVYRSAWASAAGAFELLNPSIESTIELGHATDTTLSRSAAGVMAVEGNVVPSPSSQAQNDMLVRGASSWNRLAIGSTGQVLKVLGSTPTWGNSGNLQTEIATTSSTAHAFTGIPSWVNEIDCVLLFVSLDNTSDILIQIGDSGGEETSGYTAVSYLIDTAANYEATYSSGFGMYVTGASGGTARRTTGIAHLKKIYGNYWVASGTFMVEESGTNFFQMTIAGAKELSGTLDRLRIISSGGHSFDAGAFNIYYR